MVNLPIVKALASSEGFNNNKCSKNTYKGILKSHDITFIQKSMHDCTVHVNLNRDRGGGR